MKGEGGSWKPDRPNHWFISYPMFGSLIFGISGFLAVLTFTFGESNLGPIPAIIMGCPTGMILGLILGIVFGVLRLKWDALPLFAFFAIALQWGGTWFFTLPQDKYLGKMVVGSGAYCEDPRLYLEDGVKFWKDVHKKNTWKTPRKNWEQEARDEFAKPIDGMVVKFQSFDEYDLMQGMKPWNKGVRYLKKESNTDGRYFSTTSLCQDPNSASARGYFMDWRVEGDKDPPTNVRNFLMLYELNEVPWGWQEIVAEKVKDLE